MLICQCANREIYKRANMPMKNVSIGGEMLAFLLLAYWHISLLAYYFVHFYFPGEIASQRISQ